MAVRLLRTWGGTFYAWGYELRADFTDDKREYNELFGFDREPSAMELADRCATAAARLDTMLNPPVRYRITNQDATITEINDFGGLVQIDLSITLTSAQNTALNNTRTTLKPYLAKIMWLLDTLPPEKVAELRAHNVVLDRVLDMIGE